MMRTLLAERPGRDPPAGLVEARKTLATGIAGGGFAIVPPAREERIGGIRVLRVLPPHEVRGRVLHFHGGAFRNGAPEVAARYARALAEAAGVEVLCPAYRLAPEHPFPAALNDAFAVIDGLDDAQPLILGGDSAGGGLAAAAARACLGSRSLAGLVLHSPWLDLTVSAPSYRHNAASDPLFSETSAAEAADLYLQGVDPHTPDASPLFGPAAGMPPTLVSVGTGEVLADDATRFVAALAAAGADVRLRRCTGMEHVAVVRNLDATGARETLAATVAFIGRITTWPR